MKLRLGPLPSTEVVKLPVALPLPLKQQLDRYAELHAANFGAEVDAQTLIPRMLELFLAKDRAFQRALRQTRTPERAGKSP
jgi:hypothetical protein